MKRIILVLVIVFSGILIHAQELNENAKMLKNSTSEKLKATYSDIKKDAVKNWGDDHQMIVFTINNQCDAYIEVIAETQESNYDDTIMTKALNDWGEYIEAEERYKADWVMVIYTYKNQLKAKNAY